MDLAYRGEVNVGSVKHPNEYSSEISPTRCNNCVFILRNG